MENPHIGQRVWAEDLQGTFAIVRVDDAEDVVDLELTTGPRMVEKNVPVAKVHALGVEFNRIPPRKPGATV